MKNFFHQWRIGEKRYWFDISPLLHCFQSFAEYKILMSTVQYPESSVQSPEPSIQCPESSVQSSASWLQRPRSNVQGRGFRVQRPESSLRFLRPKSSVKYPASTFQRPPLPLESRNSIMPFSSLIRSRSSHPEVFCKTGVLRSSTKFTGKHLC